jgi:multidrug efflux pump subunit AcrB
VKFVELAVRRPAFTALAFALLVALGFEAFHRIPRSEDPHFPIPIYVVVAVVPGANPGDLERRVVEPIEDAMSGLDDVKSVVASMRDGVAVLRVEFLSTVDTDEKYQEVLRELDRVRPDLPTELRSLDVERVRTSNVQVFQFALMADDGDGETLRRAAEDLENRLETVPALRAASVWGAPEREVRVVLDLPRLAALGIPVARVRDVLRSDDADIPGGSLRTDAARLTVNTSARLRSPEDVADAVLAAGPEGALRLRDVAEVRWGEAVTTHRTRFQGRPAVFVTAELADGRDIFAAREGVWRVLDAFEADLPPGLTLARGFDQSRAVDARLGQLGRDFALAIGLVLLTLLPLGLRAAGVVMVAIPLSIATGLLLLDFAGYGLNQLSIVGLVIALGLVVDDSVVVVENITRSLRAGASRTEAAIRATREISVAVLGCTATLVLSFVPLLMLPGGAGDYIRSLPLAVIFAVLGSLLVSLTLVPFLASRALPAAMHAEGNFALRLLHRFIESGYGRVLRVAVARPRWTLALAGLTFVASLGLLPSIGFSLFPRSGLPQFLVTVDAPPGAGLTQTDAAVAYAERALLARPEVEAVFANTGRGNPQVYYNVPQSPQNEAYGELFVRTRRAEDVTPDFLAEVRQVLSAFPDARIRLREFENGPPIDAPIAVRVFARDADALVGLAARVEDALRAEPGIIEPNNPLRSARIDLRVDIDASRAAQHGVSAVDVALHTRLAASGLEAGTVDGTAGDDHLVRLVARETDRPFVEVLSDVYLPTRFGDHVPLAQVAAPALETSPPELVRRNGERTVTVTAQVAPGYNTARLTAAVEARLRATDWPTGARFALAGEAESAAESFGGLGQAILLATFGLLAVLVLEFGSFRGTLVVASVLPLGVVGGLVGLALAGFSLSFTAAIGFIALMGIEIKNSILLVDFTDQLRRDGLPLEEAVRRAGEVRFVPIVLTTLTALGGLLPLALAGSSLYSPLAVVLVGGLVSSTLLARLVTPAAYKLLAPPVQVDASGASAPAAEGV